MLIYYVATVVDTNFKPASGRSITVKYKNSGDTATIYTSKDGSASGNPLNTDSNGQIKFWAPYAEYTLSTGTEELDFTIEEALGQTAIITIPISAATITIDAYEGNAFKTTLTEDVTLAFDNIIDTDNDIDELTRYELFVAQDGVGGWEITFPGSVTFLEGTTQQPRSGAGVVTKYTLDTYDNGTTWYASIGGGATTYGDVFGPSLSTDNALVRFNGAGGKTIQDSGWTLSDIEELTAGGTLEMNGNTISMGAGVIKDQYVTSGITIGESGETGLVGFTNTSIVGGLNELKGASAVTYTTVALAEAASGSDNSLCYVVETETYYRYEADGAAYTDDNTFVLSTGDGGNTRWLAIAGRYIYNDLHVFNKFYDTYVTAGIGLGESGQTALDISFINNSIVGAVNELKYSNIVKVSSLSDFPTPAAGVITLDQDTAYILNADINIGTNTIKANTTANSVNLIKSSNTSGFTLTYTGTGAMFTDTTLTTSLFINELQYSTPNGKLADIQDTTASGTGTFLLFTTQGILCAEMGDVQDVRFISFFSQEVLCGQGFTFTDCNSVTYNFMNRLLGLNLASTIYISIYGDNGPIAINGGFYGTDTNEDIIYIDPASTTTGGIVSFNQFDTSGGGSLYASGSKDQSDVDWKWIGNQGGNNEDSTVSAEGYLEGNTTATVIPAQNAWVIVNASTWTTDLLERITVTSSGILEYTGVNKTKLVVDANVSTEPATATKTISVSILNIHSHDDFTVTFDNTTNTINETGTALVNGDTIIFLNTAGTLPAELRTDVVYYVVNQLTNSFQVAYTSGGTAIAFTDNGTPPNSYNLCDIRGSKPKQPIANGAPRDLVAQALVPVETEDQGALIVQNKSDAVNITADDAYIRVKE